MKSHISARNGQFSPKATKISEVTGPQTMKICMWHLYLTLIHATVSHSSHEKKGLLKPYIVTFSVVIGVLFGGMCEKGWRWIPAAKPNGSQHSRYRRILVKR